MENCVPAIFTTGKTVTHEITHQIRAGMISRLDARFERGKKVRQKAKNHIPVKGIGNQNLPTQR
ncbi:hypothetical protein [Caballeronia sordidicola]|uniref:hypothetical protein n=1 Tax=Caballeronia sordidicola TaxID=196367 RepID=UPI00117E2E7E|nr:hypothetical protein [Caballeronia sordidicola]